VIERVAVRFVATFAVNVLRAGLSLVAGLVVARELGAADFGNLSFVLASFTALAQVWDLGTSSAFYTFLSRRPRSPRFFALYFGWLAFQAAATVLAVALLFPDSLVRWFWLGQDRGTVLLAFAASFMMTQVWAAASQLGEAVRRTVLVQAASLVQAVVHLGLVIAAARAGWLGVPTVLALLVVEHVLLGMALGPKLVRANLAPAGGDGEESVVAEFARYCAPLLVYGWVSFIYAFADRWLLQHFGGATQQGFFAVGQQLANVSLIATSSVLRVLWKEVAEATERGDLARAATLYGAACRGFYFASAWVSCLLIPFSREILAWTVGPGYEGAAPVLMLLLLLPLHQSLGQIAGTFFYATGRTRAYARIGLVVMAVSVPWTYLMLADNAAPVPGLGLAAVGLAVKMVLLQIVSVNVQAWTIARDNGVPFEWGYQPGVFALLLGLGFACRLGAGGAARLVGLREPFLAEAALTAVAYAGAAGVCVYAVPSLAGLTRRHLRLAMDSLTRRGRPIAA
jgi:O-antigen/teichoic acid export membrane protein